ncbi:DNA-processing protein DprA [Pseudogemmobacter hezensis]|uniref:DNA-processing protein DprA n=1 Tax=Pseudogemmobacter hezensis TaxID=2737662 RepID=UPI003F532F99
MADGQLSNPTHPTPPRTEEERLSVLRLIRSRRVGAVTFHRLMAEHGSAQAALQALPALARSSGVEGYEPCSERQAQAEMAAGRRAGAVPLFHGDPGYPAALATIPDAPGMLWAKGDLSLLNRPLIALIGARNASSLGVRMARRLACDLGAAGLCVVSGLARGIDAEAHSAALATGTIAVQAGGIDVIYPGENSDLAARIASEGLILAENPPGLQLQARHFPMRNRIITGLSRAVMVVEAAARSGSLGTARIALEQGREVMAVPGHPFDARSAGCNQLISDGALLLRHAGDALEALGIAQGHAGKPDQASEIAAMPESAVNHVPEIHRPENHRSENHRPEVAAPVVPSPALAPTILSETTRIHSLILDRLGPSPLAEDQLLRDLAMPTARLIPELLTLELEGRIMRQSGGLLSRR